MPNYPYYGNYMPNYYQPMQGQYQPMNQNATQQQAQQSTQSNFFCRPVASREEALAVPIDFMGAPMFFPDLAHNTIYMKRFNTDTGSADVFEFHGPQQEKPKSAAPAFSPLDEFMAMRDTIDRLKEEIEQLKKPAGRAVKKSDANE